VFNLSMVSFPEYEMFRRCCRKGLAAIYPFKHAGLEDKYGWKFSCAWPPSYAAFGRMRALLAVDDALRLEPRRVLEVAAGGAGLAATLASKNIDVSVNDIRGELLVEAVAQYSTGERVAVFAGNLFDLTPAQLGRFDLVIACEVVEHVAHPTELLAHLKEFIRPNGHLLLTTPNGSYFRNKLPTFFQIKDFSALEQSQFKPDADGHLFLFTPSELAEVAMATGYSVKELGVWGTPLLNGHVYLRLLSSRFFARVAYLFEVMLQRLPLASRQRFCFAMRAVLGTEN
jgi:2-polyprenyl-6-hydroxyphenyl methylase/3-demethylubiquinone-9 3-methyltransferase